MGFFNGVIDNVIDKMKLSENYDEDEFDEYEDEEISVKSAPNKSKYTDSEEEYFPTGKQTTHKPAKSTRQSTKQVSQNKIVKMQQNSKSTELCIIKPTNVEDGREISDTLLSGRPVVLNLEGIDVNVAQRIIDFTCGACYSTGSNLQKVTNYIFVLTPENMDISGDFQELVGSELSFNKGFDF